MIPFRFSLLVSIFAAFGSASPFAFAEDIPARVLVQADQQSVSYVEDIETSPDGKASMRIGSTWVGSRVDKLPDGTCEATTQKIESERVERKGSASFRKPSIKTVTEAIACPPEPSATPREVEFISAVHGSPDCRMPQNPSSPQPGECSVEISRLSLGPVIYLDRGVCYEQISELREISTFRFSKRVSIELPSVSVRRRAVDPSLCPPAPPAPVSEAPLAPVADPISPAPAPIEPSPSVPAEPALSAPAP